MKKLIIILLILFSVSSSSQGYKNYNLKNTYSFEYTPSLKSILDDFFEGLDDHNISIDVFENFKGIYVTSDMYRITGYSLFGVNLHRDGHTYILLNNDIPRYLPSFMSALVYHEFYHFLLKRPHHCSIREPSFLESVKEVFNGYPECPYILQAGVDINIEQVIKDWGEETKKEYFLYIKANLSK